MDARLKSIALLVAIALVACGAGGTQRAPGLYVDGTRVAFGSVGVGAGLPPPLLWQPDESNGDAVLQRVRERYVGKTVYGYGGLTMSCAPQWSRTYSATAPLRIVSIDRERGSTATLGAGTQLGINVLGPSFTAVDPLRIVFAPPAAKPVGENFHVTGRPGTCPALVLADFQVDLAITLTRPPPGVRTPEASLRVGMTRDDVIWSRGYPWEIADRGTLRREATWYYGSGIGAYAVAFRGDRVVSLAK
jgi:hypothetical protein